MSNTQPSRTPFTDAIVKINEEIAVNHANALSAWQLRNRNPTADEIRKRNHEALVAAGFTAE